MECALDSWEKMDRGSLLVRGTLANILAFYSISLGRHEDAQRYLREAASAHTGPPLNPSGLAYTAGISAIAEASLGNLNGAIHLFRSIEKLVASYTAISYPGIELRFLPTIGIGCCAELLYERNDIDEADDYLDRYFRFTDSVLMLESNILVFLTKVRIHLARGDVNKAHDALEAASQHAIHTGLAWMAPMMVWERVRIALLDGDLDRARIQARAIELPGTADDARAFIHPYDEINGAGIETIRLLIHEGEAEQALQCLEAQIKHAAAGLRKRRLVKLYILQSMALAAMGRADAALEALLNAVRIGAGMPAVRSFVDEGERCLGLLQNLAERRALQVDAKTTVYVRSLINAFQSGRSSAPPPLTLQAKPLLGAISARELDILLRVSHG
jgi:LuxR family maltose regulon positive regulatory protein